MPQHITISSDLIEITLSGTVTKADIVALEEQLPAALEAVERIGLLIDIGDWSDMTANAIREDIGFEIEMLRHIGKIDRLALISDKQWPAALARMMTPMLPDTEIAVFTTDRRDAARGFARDATGSHGAGAKPGMRLIEDAGDGLLVLEIDGSIRDADLDRVIPEMQAAMAGREDLRMVTRIKHLGGIDPQTFTHDGLFAFKTDAARRISRYAIVNAPAWIKPMAGMAGLFFPKLDIRFFDDFDAAREWALA